METDFYIEVSGADLTEGMLVVTTPDALSFQEEAAATASTSES
jgi:hypothetical protein